VQVALLTGDNAGTAERIARELGIDIVLADMLPGQKADKIKELQAQGKKVGMVGDGINDAPALTQADVGFAIGAGTDVAIESADVVLMKSDPYDVVGAVGLSYATLRKMHQNLWWAVGYNVIAFPLAAGVLYPVLLSPEIAAFAMRAESYNPLECHNCDRDCVRTDLDRYRWGEISAESNARQRWEPTCTYCGSCCGPCVIERRRAHASVDSIELRA
jgi:hypothetical protein